jgi:hypothetical protein
MMVEDKAAVCMHFPEADSREVSSSTAFLLLHNKKMDGDVRDWPGLWA